MQFKELMIEKGEKIGLIVFAGVAVLLVALGAMAFANNAFDPAAKQAELKKKAAEIDRKIGDPNATVDPLEKQYLSKFEFDKVNALALRALYFDPFAQPDNKRTNPSVVKVKSIQADALLVKIPAYDIKVGNNNTITIGVLKARKTGKDSKDVDMKGVLTKLQKDRLKQQQLIARMMGGNPTGPGGPGGGPPGMAGEGGGPTGGFGSPPGGSAGGFGSPPGGPGRGGPPGMGGGGFRPPGGSGLGSGGGLGGYDNSAERLDINYVNVEDEKAVAGNRLALTLYTQRMIVVQAALPYREQLNAIQAAMKISTFNEFRSKPEATPYFRGLEVERREIGPDGEGKWVELKFEDSYRPIFMRKYSDIQDDPDLELVKLHPANRLAMPLPTIIESISASKYPAPRLPELAGEIEKRKALSAPPPAVEHENKFKGQGDIFNPQGGDQKALAGGAFGEVGGENGFGGLGTALGGGFRPPGSMMGRGPGFGGPGEENGPGGTVQTNARAIEPLNFALVRIVDADPFIQPGKQYQYRFRLRMENPNYKKYDQVSVKSDADQEILKGDWSEPSETVTVPPETFLYAADPTVPDPKEPTDPKKTVPRIPGLKEGQAVLQMQRWQEQVRVEKFKEPFGDWLVVDTVVSRGARVGGRQLVNLPLWSSEYNNFVLRELKDDKSAKGREPRRGVYLDLTRTDLFVVDIEGGRVTTTNAKGKKIDDESAQEILLFSDEDGSMQLRSSAFDRENVDRKTREDAWKEWVSKTDSSTRKIGPAGGMPGAGGNNGRFGESN